MGHPAFFHLSYASTQPVSGESTIVHQPSNFARVCSLRARNPSRTARPHGLSSRLWPLTLHISPTASCIQTPFCPVAHTPTPTLLAPGRSALQFMRSTSRPSSPSMRASSSVVVFHHRHSHKQHRSAICSSHCAPTRPLVALCPRTVDTQAYATTAVVHVQYRLYSTRTLGCPHTTPSPPPPPHSPAATSPSVDLPLLRSTANLYIVPYNTGTFARRDPHVLALSVVVLDTVFWDPTRWLWPRPTIPLSGTTIRVITWMVCSLTPFTSSTVPLRSPSEKLAYSLRRYSSHHSVEAFYSRYPVHT